MESVLKMIGRVGHTEEVKKLVACREQGKLLEEIRQINKLIAYNNIWFQMECDGDLVDACVYQREELLARYRYLLRIAKAQGITADAFQK